MLLELGDLSVRSWRKDDLKALLHHANNPNIAANLRDQFPHPYTRRDGLDFLDYARSQDPECSFAIEYGGEVVGRRGVSPGTRHQPHQLGDGLLAGRGILGEGSGNARGHR